MDRRPWDNGVGLVPVFIKTPVVVDIKVDMDTASHWAEFIYGTGIVLKKWTRRFIGELAEVMSDAVLQQDRGSIDIFSNVSGFIIGNGDGYMAAMAASFLACGKIGSMVIQAVHRVQNYL